MNHTVRYTHLKEPSPLSIGQLVVFGLPVGTMGNTGASAGNHLHIDCCEGQEPEPWHQYQMENGEIIPSPTQLNWFIDNDLFMTKILITTHYCDPDYMREYKKLHFGYDVVPKNRHQTEKNHVILWNRSKIGKVISTGYDKDYGYYVHIEFED